MPPLNNARHERFCLAMAEGMSATAAYLKAGYKQTASATANAARLIRIDNIKTRLAELQAEASANAAVTVQSICRELDEANAVAKAKGQAAAMVSAATLRAKLAGLMVERVEVGDPGAFDGALTTAQIVDRVLARVIEQFRPVDETDREGLIALYERHFQETQEYLDAIRARPIVAERVDPRRLDKPWQQLQLHSPPAKLRSNGGASK